MTKLISMRLVTRKGTYYLDLDKWNRPIVYTPKRKIIFPSILALIRKNRRLKKVETIVL